MTEEEMWMQIERLRAVEKRQSETLKALTGKGLYETRLKPDEHGTIFIDPDDPVQQKLWNLE